MSAAESVSSSEDSGVASADSSGSLFSFCVTSEFESISTISGVIFGFFEG